jgi:2-polyprenyl-3-methyl-5-hydroxy-6-metoxy-1,4-benzoquinol methylase
MKSIIARLSSRKKRITFSEGSKASDEGQMRTLNPLPISENDHLQTRKDIYKWIEYGIDCFKEWYQPVDFGNGIEAHVTRPPDWKPQPELLYTKDGGIAKWNYIVKKHIPDVRGKRVLDLGCSSGVYCIELARMGAKEVVGIDRNTLISHRSTNTPPQQDVIAQAKFVKKAFELLDGVSYPITYLAHDIGHLQDLELGHFDVILALCVVYHELDRMPGLVARLASMTDHLVLQASQGHGGELGKWANKIKQAEVLFGAGFTYVVIDNPPDYLMPMIIGRKGDCLRQ